MTTDSHRKKILFHNVNNAWYHYFVANLHNFITQHSFNSFGYVCLRIRALICSQKCILNKIFISMFSHVWITQINKIRTILLKRFQIACQRPLFVIYFSCISHRWQFKKKTFKKYIFRSFHLHVYLLAFFVSF